MHYKPENFNCRPNTLKKISAGHYEVVGNSGRKYNIKDLSKGGKTWWADNGVSCVPFHSMREALNYIKLAVNNAKPSPVKVTFKDSTKPTVNLVPAITVDMLVKENAKKDKQIKQHEDAFDQLSSIADGRVAKLQGVVDEQAELIKAERVKNEDLRLQIEELEGRLSIYERMLNVIEALNAN